MTEGALLSGRVMSMAVTASMLIVLLAGALVGVRLGERASRADARALSIVEPDSLPARSAVESSSAGGFTGFGGPPALQGDVLRRGTATDLTPRGLVLVDGAASTTVEYSEPGRLYRIVSARSELTVGDAVLVRVDGERGTSILRPRLGANDARP